MKNSFSRKDNHRKSLMRNLVTSLILYEEIKTTKAKAKELKSVTEKLLQKSRKNDLNARRRLLGYLFDENATKKVLENILPRMKDIKTGLVKMYNLSPRLGDGAEMAVVKLNISEEIKEEKVEEKKDAKKDNKETGSKTGKTKTESKPKAKSAK